MAKNHRPWMRITERDGMRTYTIVGNGVSDKLPRDAVSVPVEASRSEHAKILWAMLNENWPDRWTAERALADKRLAEENNGAE